VGVGGGGGGGLKGGRRESKLDGRGDVGHFRFHPPTIRLAPLSGERLRLLIRPVCSFSQSSMMCGGFCYSQHSCVSNVPGTSYPPYGPLPPNIALSSPHCMLPSSSHSGPTLPISSLADQRYDDLHIGPAARLSTDFLLSQNRRPHYEPIVLNTQCFPDEWHEKVAVCS